MKTLKPELVRASARVTAPCSLRRPAAAGSGSAIKGQIEDDRIVLPVDHAAHDIWLELRNVGTKPCDIFPALTDLSMDALPVKDGRVVIDLSGAPGMVRPLDTGIQVNSGQGQPGGGEPGKLVAATWLGSNRVTRRSCRWPWKARRRPRIGSSSVSVPATTSAAAMPCSSSTGSPGAETASLIM